MSSTLDVNFIHTSYLCHPHNISVKHPYKISMPSTKDTYHLAVIKILTLLAPGHVTVEISGKKLGNQYCLSPGAWSST